MPKFKIHRSFGYVGTDDFEIIDADNLEDAEDQARDYALERVEWYAEEIEE